MSKMNNPQAVDKLWITKILFHYFCGHVDNFFHMWITCG